MMVIFLLIVCLASVLALAAGAGVYIRRTEAALRDLVTAPDDKTPSPLAIMAAAALRPAIQAAIPEITASIKGQINGIASGMARAIDGAENDVADEMLASKNPMLAAIIEGSPALQKRLKKSPVLKFALANLNLGSLGNLGGFGGLGGTVQAVPGNNHKSSSLQTGFEM